jgi:hypothetical protein
MLCYNIAAHSQEPILEIFGGQVAMQRRHQLVRRFVPVLFLLGLACGPCNLFSAEVPTPPHPIAVSTESAAQLQSRIEQNLGGEPG